MLDRRKLDLRFFRLFRLRLGFHDRLGLLRRPDNRFVNTDAQPDQNGQRQNDPDAPF